MKRAILACILSLAWPSAFAEESFIRGDANGDGNPDIADGTTVLGYLVGQPAPIPNYDAADVNDDGFLTVEDPIWLLRYFFKVGDPPPPPFPEPGLDPTPDTITRETVEPPPASVPDPRYKVWLRGDVPPSSVVPAQLTLGLRVVYAEGEAEPPRQLHAAIRFTPQVFRVESVTPLLGEGWEVLQVEFLGHGSDPPGRKGELGLSLVCRNCIESPPPVPSGKDAVEITFSVYPSPLPVIPALELVYAVGQENLYYYTGVGVLSLSPETGKWNPYFRVARRQTGSAFIRGDANGFNEDRIKVDIGDPIYILMYLFVGVSPALRCLDALDADDKGSIDLTDAIYLLGYLFLGGPPPPPPFGDDPKACGLDPTHDELDCEYYKPCFGCCVRP